MVEKTKRLTRKLTRVTLADVLEKVDVTERLHLTENRSRIYRLSIFCPETRTPLEISRVLNTTIFLVNFLRDIVGFEHEKMLVNR